MRALLILAAVASGVFADVRPDPDGAAGVLHGQVDIAAPPQVVWNTILDCGRASRMAPSVKSCRIVSRDPDGGWDVREMRVRWSFFTPLVRTVFRSEYEPLKRIRFRCAGGDIKLCEGEWRLEPIDGGAGTRVTYRNRASSPFPAPQAIARVAMKQDMTDALKALRRESLAAGR